MCIPFSCLQLSRWFCSHSIFPYNYCRKPILPIERELIQNEDSETNDDDDDDDGGNNNNIVMTCWNKGEKNF